MTFVHVGTFFATPSEGIFTYPWDATAGTPEQIGATTHGVTNPLSLATDPMCSTSNGTLKTT
jgi:hypothetical protein